MDERRYDVAVIGGGIVGMATALAVLEHSSASVVVLEAEDRVAAHQTGNNSGVIHSGLYYRPGSLKARNCVAGRAALIDFCEEHYVPYELCGKVVVATRPKELPILEELQQRGEANGLEGLRRLTPEEIKEHEPHATGIAGLLVPQTGIVDYRQVTEAFAAEVRRRGGVVEMGARVEEIEISTETTAGVGAGSSGEVVLETPVGTLTTGAAINCAGLHADRVARLAGADPGVSIVPFRGEYYSLRDEARRLVKNLIYPVPDPSFPFLGAHFTRRIDGTVEAGPNAVLAFKREGYSWRDFSKHDTWETIRASGFLRLAARHWWTGLGEVYRSLSPRAFVRGLRRLVPEITRADLVPGGAGVRAQALGRRGNLLDDFCLVDGVRMIHVLNAPSPAATASLSIGRTVAEMAIERFELTRRQS